MYKLCTLERVRHKSFPAAYTISFQSFLNFSLFLWTGLAKTLSKKIFYVKNLEILLNLIPCRTLIHTKHKT